MNRLFCAALAAPMLFAAGVAHAAASTVAFASSAIFSPAGWLIVAAVVLAAIFRVAPRARGLAIVLLAAVVCSLALDVAFAADAAAPETIAQATSETTKVTWAYGSVIAQWAGAISTMVFAGVAWLLRLLPGQIYAMLLAARADQVIQKGIDYAINMAVGASKDKQLTVDVGNKVLAQALQYVIDHAPGWLTDWMGGPEQIAQKIVARLNLAPDAVPNVSGAVEQVTT